jgi:hypothetical protein
MTWTDDQSSIPTPSIPDEGTEPTRSLISSTASENEGGMAPSNGLSAASQVPFFSLHHLALTCNDFVMRHAVNREDVKAEADVVVPSWQSVGRNKQCPCGSKRKYKSCCGTSRTRMTLAHTSRFAIRTPSHWITSGRVWTYYQKKWEFLFMFNWSSLKWVFRWCAFVKGGRDSFKQSSKAEAEDWQRPPH